MEMTPERWQYTRDYLSDVFGREPERLGQLRAAARDAGLPEIAVSADVGRLLALLTKTTAAKRILEVGTLGGYSAAWLCGALADGGKLVTIDNNATHVAFAQRWLEELGHADVASVIEGDAHGAIDDALETLGWPLDVVFLDADKRDYLALFERLASHVAPGGLFIVDNVLGTGSFWIDQEDHTTRNAVDALNRRVAEDERFDVACVPLREGVLIARRLA